MDRLKEQYQHRIRRFTKPADADPDCSGVAEDTYRKLRREVLAAERQAMVALRDDGAISDAILHQIEHELDVEVLRLGVGNEPMRQRPAAGVV